MDINLNNTPNRLTGTPPSPIQSEGTLATQATQGAAGTQTTQSAAATRPDLTISNREATIEDLALGDLPTDALDRNDALGQMITAAFNFPAPPPPAVDE